MSKVQLNPVVRAAAAFEGIVHVDVQSLWDVLTDWGMMDWWGNELEQDGMQVSRVYLDGEKGKVPRTKVLERANASGAGLPVVNRETLLVEDPVARRLYYDGTDGLILGLRNYIASWTFEPIAADQTMMKLSSTYDVVAPGNAVEVRSTLEAVYEKIIKGLNIYFAERKARVSGEAQSV